jgi:spore germination cell wall hydrolase CwlJ-like protein
MNLKSYNFLPWVILIICFTVAFFTFPIISKNALQKRDENIWAIKAKSFQANSYSNNNYKKSNILDLHSSFQRDYFYNYKLAIEQHQCLSEAIYYEARSESLIGQKAVAEVILNRRRSKHFPDTICEVVFQGSDRKTGCQFSFTCDGSISGEIEEKNWKRSQNIAKLIMVGGVRPFTENSTHYHTVDISPPWINDLRPTRKIGSHMFYRFKFREISD